MAFKVRALLCSSSKLRKIKVVSFIMWPNPPSSDNSRASGTTTRVLTAESAFSASGPGPTNRAVDESTCACSLAMMLFAIGRYTWRSMSANSVTSGIRLIPSTPSCSRTAACTGLSSMNDSIVT
ncbi:hypothetical protein D3C81_1641750 [compost metagenome]